MERVAFNPSDLVVIKVTETSLPSENVVDLEFDDFNQYGAKQRRRLSCRFDSALHMSEIWLDSIPMAYEYRRNFNTEAIMELLLKSTEELKSDRY